MKVFPTTAPGLALLLGIAAASTLGMAGWSAGARAQSTAAPATALPPAATPAVPPAAGGAAPPEVPAPGTTKPRKSHSEAGRGVTGYLGSLHDALGITPAEEPLWGAFADSMKDTSTKLGEAYRQRREQLPTMNALADLNSFIGIEQLRLDGMKENSIAFTALYQTMPPDQQKVADKLFLSDLPGAPHHKKPKG